MSKLQERIDTVIALGEYLKSNHVSFEDVFLKAKFENGWFTEDNSKYSFLEWGRILKRSNIESWLKNYNFENIPSQRVGLILAGNIPLVGLHDILCVFLAGHKAILKLSSKDEILIKHVINFIIDKNPEYQNSFEFDGNFKNINGIIATGSDNSANLFDSYFKHLPRIIRHHRNSVSILFGDESPEDFMQLGMDVFQYFGLGCRNVSHLFVQEKMALEPLLENWFDNYSEIVNNNKYKNNFDYNYAIFLLNKEKFLANDSIILRENSSISSPVAVLNYSYYSDEASLAQKLKNFENQIQCFVSNRAIQGIQTTPFGTAQQPSLMDYADNCDTMRFLTSELQIS